MKTLYLKTVRVARRMMFLLPLGFVIVVANVIGDPAHAQEVTISYSQFELDTDLSDNLLSPVLVLAGIAAAFGGAIAAYFGAMKFWNYIKKLLSQKG